MSGASSATARSEPIARRCGSEVMLPILPIPGPARHRKPALTIRCLEVAVMIDGYLYPRGSPGSPTDGVEQALIMTGIR